VIVSVAPLEAVRASSPLALLRGAFRGTRPASAWTRRLLLISQLAVTTVLLYVAGLAAHSFYAVSVTDLGFDNRNLLMSSRRTI
jgi:hypothetical protein